MYIIIFNLIKKYWYLIVILILLISTCNFAKSSFENKEYYEQTKNELTYEKQNNEIHKVINGKLITQRDALILDKKVFLETLSKEQKKELKDRGINPNKIKSSTEFNIIVQDSLIINYDTITKHIGLLLEKDLDFVSGSDSLLVLKGKLICDSTFTNCKNEFLFSINLKGGEIIIYQYTPKWWNVPDWNLFKGKRNRVQANFKSDKIKVGGLSTKIIKE